MDGISRAARVRSLFHTVVQAVPKHLAHANAHYRPPSYDRARNHRVRHLLPHALHRVLCSLVDRETIIQTRR